MRNEAKFFRLLFYSNFYPSNFESLAVTLRTAWFNTKKFYKMLTLRLCVLHGSLNKQVLLPYTVLTDWFCTTEVESVYCAVLIEYLYTSISTYIYISM
jgi:hypothetical protein